MTVLGVFVQRTTVQGLSLNHTSHHSRPRVVSQSIESRGLCGSPSRRPRYGLHPVFCLFACHVLVHNSSTESSRKLKINVNVARISRTRLRSKGEKLRSQGRIMLIRHVMCYNIRKEGDTCFKLDRSIEHAECCNRQTF